MNKPALPSSFSIRNVTESIGEGTWPSGLSARCCGVATNSDTQAAVASGSANGVAGMELGTVRGVDGVRPAIDLRRIERAVREILAAIGEDPQRDGLLETPRRVAKAYAQIFSGLHDDASRHLGRVFQEATDDVVICRDIEFYTVCEHHLLPFFGRAHIAYKPDGKQVVGLSKLARTVEVFARRPQVQERLTAQIADALAEHVRPQGVIVILESQHLCMKMRGVEKQNAEMVTAAYRGCFEQASLERSDVIGMLTRSRGG